MEENKATTMTNQKRKCIVCLTLLSPQLTMTSAIKERSVIRKFCEEIFPSETLDELKSLPGNEFETACKKCGKRLSSILRTNEDVKEQGDHINTLCKKILLAIQEHLETDGNSMLKKLKNLQDPENLGDTEAEDSDSTASSIVFRKGMQTATTKLEGLQEIFSAIAATVRKLNLSFVETSSSSRRTVTSSPHQRDTRSSSASIIVERGAETEESRVQEVPTVMSTISMANDLEVEVPKERSIDIELDISPEFLKVPPKTESESNSNEGNPSRVEVEATADLVKTEQRVLRSGPVYGFDEVISDADPSTLARVTFDLSSTSNNADQNKELIDLTTDDDGESGSENPKNQKLSDEASQAQHPSANASVADVSSGHDGDSEGDSTIPKKVVNLSQVHENPILSQKESAVVANSETTPGSSASISSAENLEGNMEVISLAAIAIENWKRKLPQIVLVRCDAGESKKNVESGGGAGADLKENVNLSKVQKKKANNESPISQEASTSVAVTMSGTDPVSSVSPAESLANKVIREVPFILPATGNRKRKLPLPQALHLSLCDTPAGVGSLLGLSDNSSVQNLESGSEFVGVGSPKRIKSVDEQEDTITESPFEIDISTLRNIRRDLLTAVKNVDVEKIKSLLQRDEVREILKRCTSPENQNKWEEYKELSTIIHKCVHVADKFFEEDPKMDDAIEIIEALINVNKALLDATEASYRDPSTSILAHGAGPYITEKLIRLGANPFAVDSYQRTLLHERPFSSQLCKLASEHPDIISKLVKMKDSKGRTPLLASLEYYYSYNYNDDLPDFFQIFQNAGADFSAIDSTRNSPLANAIVQSGDLQVIELLINFGGKLSWKGEGNKSLLHLAAQHGKEEVVRYLVNEKNFNVNVEDAEGLTPLDYLAFKILVAPVKHYHCADWQVSAQKKRYFEIGAMLQERGGIFHTKFNNHHSNQQSLLHFVAAKATSNKIYVGSQEYYRGWEVELLLRLGFPVNGKDAEGNTPLHLVFESVICIAINEQRLCPEKKEIIRILLRSGADLTAINNIGKTPREMVPEDISEWQLSEIDKLILEIGHEEDKRNEKI